MADDTVLTPSDGQQGLGTAEPNQTPTLESLQAELAKQQEIARKLQSERDKVRAELERANKLETVLGEMAKSRTPQTPEPTQPTDQDWEELQKDIDEHPHKAVQITKAWMDQFDKETRKFVKGLMDQQAEEIKKVRDQFSSIDERLVKATPDYLENRENVDRLTEMGVPLAKAIAYVKDTASNTKPTRTPGSAPIGGKLGTGGQGGEPDIETQVKKAVKDRGYTPQQAEEYRKLLESRKAGK